MPISPPDYAFASGQLSRILRTDPVLPISHLQYRHDLTPTRDRLRLADAGWIDLCHEAQLHTAMRYTSLSKGTRQKQQYFFLCASSRVAKLTHWNMRQLSGMAAIRFCFGIHSDNWELMALRRTNTPDQPIPDAIIRSTALQILPNFSHRVWKFAYQHYYRDIAVEWDSGSATRADLHKKFISYTKVTAHQLWAAPSIKRANTLLEIGNDVLKDARTTLGVVAIDWRTGKLLGSLLPKCGVGISALLEPTMREVHQPWKWTSG